MPPKPYRALCLSLLVIAGCGGGPAATPDAASPDAGSDAGMPECTTDAACDDGLYCNGTERCVAGACRAGTRVTCDDGIACTTDACSETLRTCRSAAPDVDGDGALDAACVNAMGTPLGQDCADDDANRFPGNPETCDGAAHDEDCDPTTHGATDRDADGHEDVACCNGAPGSPERQCGDDCDDTRTTSHPGATEACNRVDDDCDTHVDESVSVAGFVDADRDGYGDSAMPRMACASAAGFAAMGGDCDDADLARNPGQSELCDTVDNDCDTTVDETPTVVAWYEDADGDGFGSATGPVVMSCAPQTGRSLRATDCDDTTTARSPAAAELCNAIDDDCNGAADYQIAAGDLEDDDGDGSADATCGAPLGTDCNDRDPGAAAGQVETCNVRDDDCDGRIDEGASRQAFYRDVDGDGWGVDAAVTVACTQPSGFSARAGDCDDTTGTGVAFHPGAVEACDGRDQDCDRAVDEAEASTSCRLTRPHAITACVSASCQSFGCDAGYSACTTTNVGCPIDLRSDAANCGACGHACPTGHSCISGTCLGQPASCAELRARTPTITTDGPRTIYFGGDGTRPFTAYCAGMGGASPRTYLDLPAGTTTNYSTYVTGGAVGGTTVTTLWTRVHLVGTSIDPADFTYASSTGYQPHESTSQVPYGVARDCNCGAIIGVGAVDLTGTPFAMSTAVWAYAGSGPFGTTMPSSFHQRIDLTGGGCCGWEAPGADQFGGTPIPLTWCPSPTPETCNGLDEDCDGVVDNGCPGGVTTSPGASFGPFGGTGGGAFGDACASDEALVGFTGFVGGNVDWLQALCAPMSVVPNGTTTPFSYHVTVGTAHGLGVHGLNTTTPYDVRCPTDQVIVGMDIVGDTSVTAFSIACAPILVGTAPLYTLTTGTASAPISVTGSGGGTSHPVAPGSYVMTGIFGQSGFWMDALGVQGATPSVVLTPAAP